MSENIRALSRGLNVLEFLSETGGATRQATVAHFGLSRPTIYRLLGTLEKVALSRLVTMVSIDRPLPRAPSRKG